MICMDMTCRWSPSLIHTKKVLLTLWHILQAPGQSREASSRGDTGLSKRKWSSINCCCSAWVMLLSAYYLSDRLPSRLDKAASAASFLMAQGSPRLQCRGVQRVEHGTGHMPRMLRPVWTLELSK